MARVITETSKLILVYGPDKDLKSIASAVRQLYPGYTVNIRSTDNSPDWADAVECERRIIIESPRAQAWATVFENANFAVERMRYEGGKVVPLNQRSAPKPEVSVETIKLQNGNIVPVDEAMERAARLYGVDVVVITAWDDKTKLEAIHAAYDLRYEEQEPPRQKRAYRRKAHDPARV